MARARAELISLLALLGAVACGSGDNRESVTYGEAGKGGGSTSTGGAEQGGTDQAGGTQEGGSANAATGPAAGAAGLPEGTAGTAGSGAAGTPGQAGSPPTPAAAGAAGMPEGSAGAGGAPAEPPCETSADCSDGQVCAEYRVDGNFYCTEPLESGAAIGEECDTNLVSDECTDRLCLSFNGRCSELCTQNSDCDADSGFVCIDFGIAGFCVSGCTTTGDCAEGEVCRIATNVDNTAYHWACGVPGGSIEAGQAPEGGDCDDENDCANGLCLSATDGDTVSYFCTEPCETADDCPSNLGTCGEVTLALADTSAMACTP
jgi:hypothetical protein